MVITGKLRGKNIMYDAERTTTPAYVGVMTSKYHVKLDGANGHIIRNSFCKLSFLSFCIIVGFLL